MFINTSFGAPPLSLSLSHSLKNSVSLSLSLSLSLTKEHHPTHTTVSSHWTHQEVWSLKQKRIPPTVMSSSKENDVRLCVCICVLNANERGCLCACASVRGLWRGERGGRRVLERDGRSRVEPKDINHRRVDVSDTREMCTHVRARACIA